MNDPAQQARMKHVLHQYTGEWGSGVQARQRQTESINDVPPFYLDDGTWVIKYSVQAPGTVGFRDQNYNRKMLNCMECGVPVGVIFATEVGYKVLGLAFVERFEPENGWFGPIRCFLRPIALSSITRKRSVKRRGFCRISVFGFGGLLRSCCLIGSRGNAISRALAGACSSWFE